jgi:hypothetical protein
MANDGPFRSAFMAGFECSTHRRADGRRLDLIAATRHDAHVDRDYALAAAHGLRSVRDGVRWHLIETRPGGYDWSSLLPMLEAARRHGVQVVWDLCHYGLPDHVDVWSPDFPRRFAAFAARAAEVVRRETAGAPFFCPVNEISYWAWAGGDQGRFHPVAFGRGAELKRQLVRACVEAVAAIRSVAPQARFITAEPLIHVAPNGRDRAAVDAADAYHAAQFEALDMLGGALEPELGGSPAMLDIVGLNYYPDNQWRLGGDVIPLGNHAYRPLRTLLKEAHERYRRPMLLAETGAEGTARASWLHYVGLETRAARRAGVPLQAVCLYPILDYPGWEDDRTCQVGLFCGTDRRSPDEDFAAQLLQERRAVGDAAEAAA